MERRLGRPNLYVTNSELTEIVAKYSKDRDSFSEQLLGRPNLYVTNSELTEIVAKYSKDRDSFSE